MSQNSGHFQIRGKPEFIHSCVGFVPTNAGALPDARSRRGVNGGGEFCARPVKPFGGGRPRLRWTRALCKFNGAKERYQDVPGLFCKAGHMTPWARKLATAKKYREDGGRRSWKKRSV